MVALEFGAFRPDLTFQKPGTRKFVGIKRYNTGSRSNRYFVVRFFRVKPGRKNVTAAFRKGYDVGGVAPNQKVSVAMEVDPKGRGKARGGAKKFKGSIQLKSGNLPAVRDRVRAKLIDQ